MIEIANELFNIQPDLFHSIVDFLEIVRRSCWNFCRIEYEHSKVIGSFENIDDIYVPFKEKSLMKDLDSTTIQKIMLE